MKEASLNKRHTYPAASALLRTVTVALLILAPVVLASAQSSGPPSDSASAGRSRAEDGATRISSDSERDPISLEAIQEGVKNFELRRSELDGTQSNAACSGGSGTPRPGREQVRRKGAGYESVPSRAQAATRCCPTSGNRGDHGPDGGA